MTDAAFRFGRRRGFRDLPMPPANEFGIVQPHFFKLEWHTLDIPEVQEVSADTTIVTPQFDHLMIYGRMIKSPYPEDALAEQRLFDAGRVMGEWFSTACPYGEIGSHALGALTQIDAEEFSAAFQRGWAAE